jgi:hypothetical protein
MQCLRFCLLSLLAVVGSAAAAESDGSLLRADCMTDGNDGFAGAPIAPIQYPTTISRYKTRPPWCVAGVGYAVGIPAAQQLSDPFPSGSLASGILSVGGSYPNPPNHVLVFTANAATIEGWDFSLEGGWTVVLQANNLTLQNNNFKVGQNLRPPIFIDANALNPTIKNNVIDGNAANINPAGGLIQGTNGGTGCGLVTIQYNWIKNAYYQHMQLGACGGPTQTDHVIKYNILEMAGYGAPFGAHGDVIQEVSSTTGNPVLHSLTANYNLVLQNDPAGGWATQGFSIPYSGGNTLTFGAIDASNNVFLIPNSAQPKRNINYAILIDVSWLNGRATVNNNYIDPAGVAGNWIIHKAISRGRLNNEIVSGSGNRNMLSGAECSIRGIGCRSSR